MGGNDALARLGTTPASLGRPRIVANEHVVRRMVASPAVSRDAWPNDDYFTPDKDFFFNGEAVIVTHMPAAATDGDSIVFFRRSDVIATGDLFTPGRYPVIDLAAGGSVQGEINALNVILHVAVPAKYQEGGTYIIPGHGRLCDEADVVEYREMVTVVRDRVQDLIKKGSTLEQVKAARPTRDYDAEYARPGSPSPDAFVESVYRSLVASGFVNETHAVRAAFCCRCRPASSRRGRQDAAVRPRRRRRRRTRRPSISPATGCRW